MCVAAVKVAQSGLSIEFGEFLGCDGGVLNGREERCFLVLGRWAGVSGGWTQEGPANCH